MKIALLIIRLLLGLVFFVFGLNAFLNFIPAELPPGEAGEYVKILIQSHYVLFVGGFQVVGGALLLVNRYVPLALTLLGPVIVNILLFHLLLNHQGAGGAILVTIFWGILAFHHRQYFASLFVQRTS
jgi:putative oxidoreductase